MVTLKLHYIHCSFLNWGIITNNNNYVHTQISNMFLMVFFTNKLPVKNFKYSITYFLHTIQIIINLKQKC